MNNCITDFWSYFTANNFAFMMLNELEIEIKNEKLNELKRLLHHFHPKLGFLLNSGYGQYNLIITAYGNPYLFKSVELLVKYAPEIINWDISAFIQPSTEIEKYKNGTDAPFNYHGISLKISEMKYTIIGNETNPLQISLNIFIKNYIVCSYDDYLVTAVYTLLELLLGEKSFTNEIVFVNISQLTADVELNQKPVPLFNLPDYINLTRKMSAEELA